MIYVCYLAVNERKPLLVLCFSVWHAKGITTCPQAARQTTTILQGQYCEYVPSLLIIVFHLGNMSSVTSILNVKVSRLCMPKSWMICPKSAAHLLCMLLQMWSNGLHSYCWCSHRAIKYCNQTCGPFLILGSRGGWRLPRRDTHNGIHNCL